jgi:DNA-binding transcriptional MerR regulator
MSRVVEGDQRMFHDKVFPILLEAFGITDWSLELPTPEEKAEATRISFAQQRVSVASQLNQMGFTVRLQDQGANLEEIAFVIEGESVPMTQFQGESQALQIEQTMQQMEQQEQQQQMQQQQQEMMGGASPEGGEEGEGEEGEPNEMAQAQVAQDEDEDEDENLNDPEPEEGEEE